MFDAPGRKRKNSKRDRKFPSVKIGAFVSTPFWPVERMIPDPVCDGRARIPVSPSPFSPRFDELNREGTFHWLTVAAVSEWVHEPAHFLSEG